MPATSLLVTCGFSKFRYAATVASGTAKGELRLKTLPKDPIVIDFDGRTSRIDYVRTRDGLVASDFRFSLVDGDGDGDSDGSGETLAFADKVHGRRDYVANVRGTPFRFEKRPGVFSLHYALLDDGGRQVGTLAETTGFTLWKRSFRFDLPESVDGPTGLFLFFLAVNLHFR
ncbi:MAG: hypothetical protein ACTHOH_18625 [Lysobacteraceae bacterium]